MGFWDRRDIHFGSKLLFKSQQRKIHSGQPFSNSEMHSKLLFESQQRKIHSGQPFSNSEMQVMVCGDFVDSFWLKTPFRVSTMENLFWTAFFKQ